MLSGAKALSGGPGCCSQGHAMAAMGEPPEPDSESKGECSTCKQSTDDYERALLPETYVRLKWMKFDKKKVKRGNEVVGMVKIHSGYECYACFDTRRGHYSGHSQEEVNAAIKDSDAVKMKHEELRSARVRGVKKKGPNEQASLSVVKKKTEFTDEIDRGTFSELFHFCRNRAPPGTAVKTRADCERLVASLGLEIETNDRGIDGVIVWKTSEQEYEVKRARRKSIEKVEKREVIDSQDSFKQCFPVVFGTPLGPTVFPPVPFSPPTTDPLPPHLPSPTPRSISSISY